MHAAFQLPFSGRCWRQVYGTVTSLKECGSVLNSRLWGAALREDRKNGCEADYAFGKLVIMSLVPEKSMGMPNTHSKIHSTTNGRPIQYHHLTLSSGVWGVMGRRKVRQRDERLSLFILPIIPCSRRALRAKTTGDKSVSSLRSIMRCISFGHNIYKFICILVNFKS